MHCRYFAETKTLWEHLNNPAATTQVVRPVTVHVLRVYGYGKHVIGHCDDVLTMLEPT